MNNYKNIFGLNGQIYNLVNKLSNVSYLEFDFIIKFGLIDLNSKNVFIVNDFSPSFYY